MSHHYTGNLNRETSGDAQQQPVRFCLPAAHVGWLIITIIWARPTLTHSPVCLPGSMLHKQYIGHALLWWIHLLGSLWERRSGWKLSVDIQRCRPQLKDAGMRRKTLNLTVVTHCARPETGWPNLTDVTVWCQLTSATSYYQCNQVSAEKQAQSTSHTLLHILSAHFMMNNQLVALWILIGSAIYLSSLKRELQCRKRPLKATTVC